MAASYVLQRTSGIVPLDDAWGGLYRGGSYLVYGPQGSGRNLLALAFTQTGFQNEEPSLFISPRRPRDLRIQATTLGFDLRTAYDSGIVRLMRTPPSLTLHAAGDDRIEGAVQDFVAILHEVQPARVVVDDFVPFVQFASFDRFRTTFMQMLDALDPLETTLLLVMAEPANRTSRHVVELMQQHVTGTIHTGLPASDDVRRPIYPLTLTATLGHPAQPLEVAWAPFGRPPAGPDDDDASSPTTSPSASRSPSIEAVPLGAAAGPRRSPPIQTIPLGSRPANAAPRTPEAPPEPAPPTPAASTTQWEVFQTMLQHYFRQRDRNGLSFLLIALRMTPRSARLLDFDEFVDLIRPLLRSGDDLLVDPIRQRMVLLLVDRERDDGQQFFATVKQHLRETLPHDADTLLQDISAIVVPDGRPFQRADEFLTYALEEN